MASALQAAGFSSGTGGGFGMLPDPDGLELQIFQPPAGLVAAAVPSPLPVESNGLVKPLGVDHADHYCIKVGPFDREAVAAA